MTADISTAPIATAALARSDQNLIWLDCEMTGLDPDRERIIEIAVIVTGPQLVPRIESPVFVIHQSDTLLDAMDDWNRSTHGKSGLIDKVRGSRLSEADAEGQLLAFVGAYVGEGSSPMCGSTIGQDRRFLRRYMPRFESYFHYRNIDVSTVKELARRWAPELADGFKKKQAHTALADVHESIDELEYYRARFMRA